ncbi:MULTISPECIES: FecR family protein [Olivibacter]|uniref:FecR family protein n=1 Tax=Olivibacter oleidegradans TaxID=760123 RepID=A0ABV6HU27_9SPHI|nr:FecR family protein [Olivibacter sp. 47]MDM8176278.1 FecR domain-containing protein [Olivibacter sp. 47]
MYANRFRRLLRKYHTKRATPEERRLVDDWYNSFDDSPRLTYTQRKILRNELHTNIQKQLFLHEDPIVRKMRWLPFRKLIAASILLCTTGMIAWLFIVRNGEKLPSEKREWVEVAAAAGRLKKVTLPDSTEVWLNTDTKIGFFKPFEHGETREVTLLEGEAFFSVSPDKTKPFIVHAQGIETRVLGTSFTVHAYKELDELRVSVSTGMVQVRRVDGYSLGTLSRGEEVVYNKVEGTNFTREADPEVRSAWTSGTTYFSEASFAELALAFRHTYGLHLKAHNEAIFHQRYSIQLDRHTRYDDFVKALCAIHKNRYRKEENAIIIY